MQHSSYLSFEKTSKVELAREKPASRWLIFIIQAGSMKVKGKRFDAEKWVYKFSTPATMRFKPKEDYQQPKEAQNQGFLQRIRNYFSPPSQTKQMIGSRKGRSKGQARLKYVKSLTNQDVLIGNEDQLDAMGLADIIQDFVDTKFHWSLKIGRPILHVAVDSKRNVIVLLPERQLLIYRFNAKIIGNKPKLEASIKLQNNVKFVQIMKEGSLVLCYATGIQIYSVEENIVRLTAQKKFNLPSKELQLLVLPTPFQNILNIFFWGPSEDPQYFSLWNIELEMLAKEVRMGTAIKIYDLKHQWLTKLRIQNYSKEIYLISLDRDILAVRKGYMFDKATVNSKQGNNHLKYLPGQKLIHVSDFRVELYHFTIDIASNPPRISISSTDSIQLPEIDPQLEYFNIVEVLGSNFALFYQTRPEKNILQKGQIYYSFIVSSLMQRQEKIKKLLPAATVGVEIDRIVEKADMAGKMGLERKDIYLRLWNNSQKRSVQDFKLLLDTLDYDTIRAEIEKKLKKHSMNFREVLLLEQGCLSMLANNVFSIKNTKEDIRNYLISHLLIRKLEFYKQISLIDQAQGRKTSHDPSGRLLINIQNYNTYRTMDIKTMLLQLISKHCSQEKSESLKIRSLIRFFRFPLRVVYQDLLVEIINTCKKKLVTVLEAIPQLLPFDPYFDEQPEDIRLYEGIWKEYTVEEWQKSLYNDTVSTIDNKENLAQVCNSVWFKRYWLTLHEYVNLTKAEIQQIHQLNCSEYTFFNALDSIFDQIKEYPILRTTIDFIQDHYPRMPEHLIGKIFLYRRLYEQFRENEKGLKTTGIGKFRQFLSMKDEDIFRDMFIYEKVKKGFILKEMKPLYSKLAGVQVFHQGLLNYFASSQSAISDIKYLLNRMNNQKKEFHEENEGIYEVLVRGMQLKLRLGGNEDVPIEEVLIYIENIPFSADNPVMKDLDIMRLINMEAARFRKIGLNMTIFEMTRNIDSVIAAMVHYEVAQAKIVEMKSQQEIKNKIYQILAEIQVVNEKIFAMNEQDTLTLFCLLTHLLEEQSLITLVASLLIDPSIAKHFPVSKYFAQNIVLYMRKWKLTSQPSYFLCCQYLRKLAALLPQENTIRKYIEAQCILGQLLSVQGNHVMYPLSKCNSYFTSLELQETINKLPSSKLLQLDVNHLFNAARTVQLLSTDQKIDQLSLINTHEIILLRLIECGALKDAIIRIEILMQLQGENPNNFIFPAIVAAKISPEFIEQNRQLFLKCASYLFKQPEKLLALIKEMMTVKATNNQHKSIIQRYYNQARCNNLIYSQKNPLLDPFFRESLQEDEKQRYGLLLRETLQSLLMSKQEFGSNPIYHMIYAMLCNDPYVLIKFFSLGKYILNFKQLRLFLSFLSKQQVFAKIPLLEFGKRMFYISFRRIKYYSQLQPLISEDSQIPLDTSRQIQKFPKVNTFLLGKLVKGCQRFKLKIKSVQTDLQKRKSKGIIETDETRLARFKEKLANPTPREGGYEYPYMDSDNRPKAVDKKLEYPSCEHAFDTFDSKFERSIVLFRTGEELTLYVSVELERLQRQRFYQQKRKRENIYSELTLQKQTKKAAAELHADLNDAVRNSMRRSRNWLKISDAGKQSPPLKQSRIDNASIHDLQQKISKISSLKASHISFAPLQETHEQDLFIIQQIRKNEEKILTSSSLQPQFGNTVSQSQIISTMLGDIKEITDNVYIDFAVLEQYSTHERFGDYLRQIAETAYKRTNVSFKEALIFIRRLSEGYEQLKVKRQWLQIYMRAEQLQARFNLQLPMKEIFKVQGLFVDSDLSDRLFQFLLPNIISQLADQQLFKMCKVITLSFKKSELEQEILFSSLVQLLTSYQRQAFSDVSRQPLVQKISALLERLPIKLIKRRDEELRRAVEEEDCRVQIGNLLVATCQRKMDPSTALYFENKWINKKQIPNQKD